MEQLDEITRSIYTCSYCISRVPGKLVPGEGRDNALLMMIGEAPGKRENETGRPFVGSSGRLLEASLNKFGIKREDIFITSVLKYFPGKRTIAWEEIQHGLLHLVPQIKTINPRLIVLMGNVALRALSGVKTASVTKMRGSERQFMGYMCFPTFHPAALFRVPSLRNIFDKDMEKVASSYRRITNG